MKAKQNKEERKKTGEYPIPAGMVVSDSDTKYIQHPKKNIAEMTKKDEAKSKLIEAVIQTTSKC